MENYNNVLIGLLKSIVFFLKQMYACEIEFIIDVCQKSFSLSYGTCSHIILNLIYIEKSGLKLN